MKKIMKTMALCAAFALIFGLGSCANQTGGSDANTPAETPDAPNTPVYPANGNLTKPDGDNLADVVADLDLSGTWKLVYGYGYEYMEWEDYFEAWGELKTVDEMADYITHELNGDGEEGGYAGIFGEDSPFQNRDDKPRFNANNTITFTKEYADYYFNNYVVHYFNYIYSEECNADVKEAWCVISKDRKTITMRMEAKVIDSGFGMKFAIIYEKQS